MPRCSEKEKEKTCCRICIPGPAGPTGPPGPAGTTALFIPYGGDGTLTLGTDPETGLSVTAIVTFGAQLDVVNVQTALSASTVGYGFAVATGPYTRANASLFVVSGPTAPVFTNPIVLNLTFSVNLYAGTSPTLTLAPPFLTLQIPIASPAAFPPNFILTTTTTLNQALVNGGVPAGGPYVILAQAFVTSATGELDIAVDLGLSGSLQLLP